MNPSIPHDDQGDSRSPDSAAETGDSTPPIDTQPEPECVFPEIEPNDWSPAGGGDPPTVIEMEEWACGDISGVGDNDHLQVTADGAIDGIRFDVVAAAEGSLARREPARPRLGLRRSGRGLRRELRVHRGFERSGVVLPTPGDAAHLRPRARRRRLALRQGELPLEAPRASGEAARVLDAHRGRAERSRARRYAAASRRERLRVRVPHERHRRRRVHVRRAARGRQTCRPRHDRRRRLSIRIAGVDRDHHRSDR